MAVVVIRGENEPALQTRMRKAPYTDGTRALAISVLEEKDGLQRSVGFQVSR